INDTIRYLSCDTNQYIRYFVGHKGPVTSLQRSPDQGSSTLLSASMDESLRIWDLEQVEPVCTIQPTGARAVADGGIVAAYDLSGAVVAAVVGSSEIKLFDAREMSRGPFLSSAIDPPVARGVAVAGVKFVPPVGDHLLLVLTDGSILVHDAATLAPLARLSAALPGAAADGSMSAPVFERMRQAFLGQSVTATPDGKSVIAGCADGSVVFWDLGRAVAQASHVAGAAEQRLPATVAPDGAWNGSHDGPVGVCAFNPLLMECATGSRSLAFWTAL
ncbi:hypothetical protein IWQ56_006797, partial [Coemansia nantahalensis]